LKQGDNMCGWVVRKGDTFINCRTLLKDAKAEAVKHAKS
jgi:hypothetical protein